MTVSSTSSRPSALVDVLGAAVGTDKLVADADDLATYGHDKGPFPGVTPALAVKAETTDDVAAVLRVASEHSAPVVVRGGGFALGGPPSSGGEIPIVLDTRALDRVIDIDEEGMTVTAECGILMADLEAAVAERGFEVHTVAVPRAYTTLGGVLSGVCGGGFPSDIASVGGSGQFVLGLRVVLPNGTILDTNAGGSNVHRAFSSIAASDGPHATQLFIGDGGALGVKVRATLAMHPVRREVHAGAYEFDSFEQAWGAVTHLNRRSDGVPYSKLYVMKGSPWGVTYAVKAGTKELMSAHVAFVDEAMRACGGVLGRADLQELAQANAEMDPAWADQFITVARGVVAFVFGNREFPRAFARMRELFEVELAPRLAALGIEPPMFACPYGRHAVWAAITLPYDGQDPVARAEVADMTRKGHELLVELGGWSELHQGELTKVLAGAWSPEYRAFFELLKNGVDPSGVLNRGLWDRTSR